MALPAGFVIDKPEKVKLPSGFVLDSQKDLEQAGLPSIVKREPREAPAYDPLGQVIGDVPAPLDYEVEGQGRMNEPGAFTTFADLAKQFIAPGAKAPFALPLATETAAKGFVRQAMEQPESSLTSAVQPGIVRLLSPLLMQQKEAVFGPKTEEDRLKKQLEVQRTIASIPSIPGAKALNKIGENVQKDILGSLSPEAKKALQESQITGNIFEGEVDFGTNPNAYGYALQAANVFGSMAPVIATAMVTKSPGAGGFVGGTMAADEAATKAAEYINKIPDAELRQKSPIYAQLIAAGASPKEARELTVKKAAESGAALQGLVATFGDVLTGKLVTGAFDKAIAKLGTNRLARTAGVGTASSLEEAVQETGEGLASDVTLKNVIPSKELGEDSAANFILGALGGAGPGFVKGALSEGEPKAPEREKYVQPEGGLAELMARQKGFLRPEGGPPAAPPAPAPVPPAPPAGPAETIQAPESEAMDTQAMLQELINSVNYPQEKAPEVVAEKPVEAPPIEAPKEEAPQEELTLKEQYDKAAKLNLKAPDAFRNRRITQEQYDQIQADYERIKTEYQASIPRATLTPIQQEATDIADGLEALGQTSFVTGMRSAIERNQVNKDNLEFYRSRLKQEQAKQDTLDEGIERPSEKFEWTNFFRDEPKGLDKLKLFNSKAPPAAKQALQTVTDTLQALTNRLNDEGYTMYGTPSSTIPQEIKNLRSQIQMRSAGGVKLINAFEALNKGFKRSKNTTNQQNLDAAIQDIKVDAAEAQKVLQRSIPEPEEVVNARAGLAEANKRVEDLQYKSESLWGALKGKLNPEEVREIFGPNPNLGNKKLGVTKKSGLRGTYISEMADDGLLDAFLPVGMRRASGNFDSAQASQYIKDAVANKDYLPDDAKEEIKQIYRAVEPLGDLIDEYLTIEEQNRELQIAFDEQREADQAAEIVEPEGEDRPAEPSEGQERELKLTAPTKDELTAKQDEIDRLSKENERLSKEAEAKAKADEEAKDFVLTGSKRDADQAAARGQKDIFAEAPAEEAPVDNKQEIADLRKEQKTLMLQIIKARLEETPEQEARMAEISKRLDELEGRAPVKQVEKPVVKQRSVEEIREELEDLQDQASEEFNKDKKKKLASDIYKLQAELTTAEGRAARAAAESTSQSKNKLDDPAEFEKALKGFEDAYGDPKSALSELNYYKNTVDSLIKKGGSIYRVLFVKSINDINEKNLGNYWTIHSSNIDRYGDNLSDNADEGTQPYVVQAKVPPNSISNQGVDISGNPDEEEVNIVANKDDITYTVHEYSNKRLGPAIRELGKTEAETEAAEEAAEEAIRNKAEAEIDEGPIGQAIAKIENGDIETKAQIRTFIKKLERDGILDDVEDVREGLSDREQDASEVLDTLSGLLDDARDNAIDERFDELLEESAQEEPEAPEGTVATPDGAVLRYPLAVSLVGDGYKVLALDDARTYKDKGGEPHRTFEKGPLRIAMTSQRTLFQNRNSVNTGFGNPDDVTLEAIMVDPGKRNQGLATQAMNDVIEAADKNEITLYLEPVPIVNVKKNDFGLDRDQLVDFYSKFGFEFQEDSNKVMERKPNAEVEVLPAEEPQIAGQVGFEPYTIEGDFTEVAEEQQRLMLENQTENLSDDQVSTLEKHYGATIDSDEFFTKLREDVTNFIVKGATAVNGKIRAIIRQLANGVLAVGIAFNPQYMSQPINVFMPVDNVRTEEVLAQVPDAATDKMSEPAKRAFAVIYPALQEQMVAKDKLFIMADKPSGRVFVFNPDGSLLLEKKSLFGLAKGDLYVGDNDKPQNRITPAGLFDLKFVDAAKGAAEKRTAGDYDTGTVLAINDPDGTITIMHSVWLKEKDAAQRAAALRNDSPADSRYSFGCINVDAPTYKFLVNNHAKQMDGAALFIVPEAGVDVMSFITGKGAMSEDLARIKIKPVTKEVRTPQRQATQTEAQTKTPGREQQFFSLEKQTGTPAFKKFFGDSKVVDEDGNPMIVYHGTIVRPDTEGVKGMGDIMAFDRMFTTQFRKPSIDTVGSFFSTNPGEGGAQMYSGTGEGAAVYPVYLSIKNPYTTTFETMLRRARMMENGVDDGRKIGAKEVQALRKFLKEAGKDGIHIKADPKSAEFKDQDVWIALEPEQIKSATGNRGTFDESANINMSLGDDMVRLVNQIADSIADNEKKRSPSFKRTAKTLTRQRGEGKITDEEYLDRMNAAIEEDEESRLDKGVPQRVRGADFIREKLLNAKRRKMITAEGVDLAEWFIQQNPALVDDLGISVKGKGLAGVGGFYNSDSRIINLIKDAGSSQTATHEILHHLERMMPTDIQNAIRKAWLTQLLKANKAAKDPAQRLYFMALLDAHIGNNNHDRLEIPKDLEKIYKSAVKQMQFASALAGDPFGSSKSSDLAKNLLLYSPTVTNDLYEYFDPSEFWAVNGSDIVQARYEAVKGGVLAKLKNWLREFTQKIKSLLGLKSDASIIRALDSLAKSDGKFVTRKMLGTGEYRSIERRNYEGGEAPEPDMEIPEMSFMDDVIYKYGDKLIDTKRLIQSIQSTGRKIDERFDAYMKEENYHGRLAKRTKNFLNDEMRPVLEDMQERGVTLDELETFLLNRHAKEANAYIARINPTGFPEAGSSVSDAAADKYMAELTPEKRKDLMALATKVDKIVKETQRVLVANGLETQDTIDEWNATYKNYVPLQRDQLDFVHTGRGVMGGFATRGSASKRRVGSDKPVIDIFANIAMQRERALRRSEQARVGRALYGMAIKHPNPGFWLAINPDAIKDKDKLEAELISLGLTPEDARSIIQEPRQPMFDKKTGTVKYQVNPLLRNSPNVFPIRINGEDRFIFFNPNDPRALRMVESIKNLDTERLGDVIGTVGLVTRWFASVNTQYNIVFGGVNFLRDLSAASLNLSTTEIAGKEKQVRANVLPALRAIYRDLRGKGATTEAMAEMQDWFERFQMAGGQTGYQNQFAETKRKGNVVEQELKRLNRGNVKKSVDAVFDWLSDYNDAIENAVRLSAFKVAVESGLSEDKAASIAKNLTVNFNRKGARTGLISSLYAFFNAAVQGSARMVETLRGPMGKKIIFGGMFLGSMQAIALAMAGFDDDEPPEFVKDKNLIIPIPYTDKKYLSIPMPLGFNMFPGFGRLAMETLLIETGMIRSRKGPGDKVMSAVSLVFDAFNPLGGAGNPLLMAVPTIGDPLAAIYSNRDAFGRPIYKEDRGTAPTPGYERSRENASLFSKKLAEAINWATSPAGTQHTKGKLSPTADEIDYFIGQITGGVGREIMKVGEFAKSKAVTQEEVPAYKLPIVGRFYGEAESPAATRSRFYENVKEMAKHEHEIKGLRKDRVSPTEYVKANPEARLWQRANNVENQIVKLNKEKRAMIERDAPREAVKRKEDEILKKMTEFNDQVRRGQ
jgi:GNAT superfamily N-acetyltransferase